MPKVYITQENPNFDYSPVEKFGEPTFVTANDFSGTSNSLFNDDMAATIRGVMGGVNVDEDYIVPSGSPLVTAFCLMALRDLGVKRFPILRWSNRDREYRPVVITF